MKNMRNLLVTLLTLILPIGAFAAPKTVTVNEFFCEPVDLLIGCEVINTAGRHEVQVTPDSMVIVNLTIGVPTTHIYAEISKGERFLYGCDVYSAEGEYADTLVSAHGCDSVVVLHLSLNWCDTAYSESSMTLCQKELPYTYVGAKQYIITKDTTIIDVVKGGAASGCDSIATIHFAVNRVVPVEPENQTICDGDFYTWRGKKLTEAGVYSDTVRYATSGCDSAIYVLNLKVDKLVVATPESKAICQGSYFEWRGKRISEAGTYIDTVRHKISRCDSVIYTINVTVQGLMDHIDADTIVCPGTQVLWRYKYYKAEGTYYDTVRYKSGCDSIIYSLTIHHYTTPEVPMLGLYSDLLNHVVCGQSIDADMMLASITYDTRQGRRPTDAEIPETWMEVRLNPTDPWVHLTYTIHPDGQESIDLRFAALTACGDVLYSMPVTFLVEGPSPENTSGMDNLPAVSKYNNWLLMLNLNKIHQLGLYPAEEDVTWYRILGTIDPIRTLGTDQMVGNGYYFTADQSLTGRYYALIRDKQGNCDAVYRTVVITCEAAAQMALTPRKLRNGEAMTLSHLDANQPTEISIYATDGRQLYHTTLNGVSSYDFCPTDGEGIYLMRAVNGEQSETFKYIVTK